MLAKVAAAPTLSGPRPVPTVFRSKEIADTFQRASKWAAEDGKPIAVVTGPRGNVFCDCLLHDPLDQEFGYQVEAIAYPSTAFSGGQC